MYQLKEEQKMKKLCKGLWTGILIVALLVAGMGGALGETADAPQVDLLVSAAASLTDVMPMIADAYAQVAPNVTVTYTYGSSGALRAQIEEGAPADVYVSANQKHMNTLLSESLILEGSNRDVLENKVVLIVPLDSALGLTSFAETAQDAVSMVAMGEPTAVPAGQYAQQVFESLGIWETISAKANFGSDVRQVLTWVENGEVDCGVVYATDAMTSDMVAVVATAPEGSCDKIIYPAAALASTANADAALAYLDFLQTDEAQAIFASFGFSPAPAAEAE